MTEPAPYHNAGIRFLADPARDRILDAAFECAQRFGLARMTMADVAKQAHLSRQTVYRYYFNRHALIAALVLREEERMVARVRVAIEPHRDLLPAVEAAFETTLRMLRAHPLLDKVMATEPQELLPYLTIEANPVLSLGMRLMEEVLTSRGPNVPPARVARAAETCARVFISYAITPPSGEIGELASSLAELICNGLTRNGGSK